MRDINLKLKYMEHTNKIIIKILADYYADYYENTWHYDEQYKMMQKAIDNTIKQNNKTELPDNCNIPVVSNSVCLFNGGCIAKRSKTGEYICLHSDKCEHKQTTDC